MKVTRTLERLLAAIVLCLIPTACFAGYFDYVEAAPPPLPQYAQPPCPAQGYLWTPGYWAHGTEGYYWVPGVWVQPPRAGVLWTPGYWGTAGRVYVWHTGYWAADVGFYGGVHYGFGYNGSGFDGGVWLGEVFRYKTPGGNLAVVNPAVINPALMGNSSDDGGPVLPEVHPAAIPSSAAMVAAATALVRPAVLQSVSFNGARVHAPGVSSPSVSSPSVYGPSVSVSSFNGPGGADALPSAGELAAGRELRFRPTAAQLQQAAAAALDRSQLLSVNHGLPVAVAMDRVGGHRYNRQGQIADGVLSGRLALPLPAAAGQ